MIIIRAGTNILRKKYNQERLIQNDLSTPASVNLPPRIASNLQSLNCCLPVLPPAMRLQGGSLYIPALPQLPKNNVVLLVVYASPTVAGRHPNWRGYRDFYGGICCIVSFSRCLRSGRFWPRAGYEAEIEVIYFRSSGSGQRGFVTGHVRFRDGV